MNDPVFIICYNGIEVMDRHAAELRYMDMAAGCEGSERDRYMNVYCELKSGKRVCTDGYVSASRLLDNLLSQKPDFSMVQLDTEAIR